MKKIGLLLAFLAVFLIGKQGMEQAVETVNELSDEEHPEIALTFDDGPHEVYTGQLLDGLKERGVQVTFFLIGQNIEGKEDVVKRMKAEGHLIGNHTYHHVNLKEISEKKAEEEKPETTESSEKDKVEDDIQMPEDKSPFGTYLLIALVAVGAAAGGYYFKVYKPKHEYDDEDEMEEDEDESEDSESEKREVDDADEQEESTEPEILRDEDFDDAVLEDEEEEQE